MLVVGYLIIALVVFCGVFEEDESAIADRNPATMYYPE